MSNVIPLHPTQGYLNDLKVEQVFYSQELMALIETKAICRSIEARERMRKCNADMKAVGLPQKFNPDF